MSPENDGQQKAGEPWWKRSAGLALIAALLVGGTATWLSRSRGERISFERGVASGPRGGGAAVLEVDLEEKPEISAWMGQVLRGEAKDSTVDDRRLVWMFLGKCSEVATPVQSVDWFGVDEALTWLRGAVDAAPEIEVGLTNLGCNRSGSESLRCFALQHLGMWAEEHPLGEKTVAQLRLATGEMLAGGVSGAALRILNRTRSRPAEGAWLRARVLELLENEDSPTEQRVAALQIAVELDAIEVEPVARRLAEPRQQVAERVGAFLALGRLGNEETLRWLNSQPQPVETLVLEAKERALLQLARH